MLRETDFLDNFLEHHRYTLVQNSPQVCTKKYKEKKREENLGLRESGMTA